MKFRLQCRRLTTIMIAVLTVVLAFFFVSPASADQVATPVTVMQSTNQPNAPNASEQQSAQPAKQTSLGNTNSQETNQSTSTSDAANANKSATTAAQSTENSTVTNDSSKAQAGQTSRSAVAPTKQVTPNSVQVTIKNGNNDHLINNGDTIDQFTPIRVEVSYDFTGGNIHPGDYFTFSVPDKLSVTSGSTIETNLGTVSIVGNTGRFIFNTEGSDAHGEFFFTVQINPQHTSNGEDVPINITINNVTHPTIKIHYAPGTVNPDERFSKYTMNNDLSKGNLKYAIRVNPTGDVTYTDAVIADQLHTPGFTYKRDSFQVYKVKWSWNGTDWNNQMIGQLDISPVISADGASFTIDLGNQIVKNENHEGFLILYELLYNGKSVSEMTTDERPSDGTVVSNSASLNSSNHSTINYPQTLTVINSGGHGNVQTFDLVVTKVDDFDHPLSGATFQLFRGNDVVGEATTDANGIVRFHGLLRGTYRLHEVSAPAGYKLADDVTISPDDFPASDTEAIQKKIVDHKLISKTVTKHWDDANNQDGLRSKDSITVHLIGKVGERQVSDQPVTILAKNGSNDWTATVDDLPEYNNGEQITYSWTEPNVPAGYQVSIDGDKITNTHTPATISKTVTKKWVDNENQDGLRPSSIKVNLLANGQVARTIELTAANNWTATIDGLAQKANGQDITYTWQEAEKVPGYQSKVEGDKITNTHTPATISKTVTKKWVDNDNQDGIRPSSVKVNLLANGQVARTIELTAANNWTATIDGLAQKANGNDIAYTWQEAEKVPGYQASVEGDIIKNTHTPATISKTVTKKWVDNDNQDGIRPSSVKVNLLANGQVVRTVEVTAANNWTASIDGLAQKANGQDITYTWQEAEKVPGYQASVDGDTITNTHTPATISKTVTKEWEDANNQDGIRPSSIKVNLLADGQVVKTVGLTAANNWTATIKGLAQKANGQLINYTWEEADVPAGYQASVDGNTIKNTHTPATTSKTVTKRWVDNGNQDGIRPSSIKVSLLANGNPVKTVELTAANNWTATIDGLAQKANGQLINYTWQEADVPAGYQASVDGDIITNTHVPATISKTVTKHWADNDNQDGIRPNSIKVNLLANGQVVKTVELTAANNWTAAVDGLAQKANGNDIAYAWQEIDVPAGYQSAVDGDVITNTHAPLTTKVTITKVWNDANNQDGLRPASVTVNLLANGQVIRTVELSAANDWRIEIDNLMMYSHQGQRVVYTVEEANVPAGYQSVVSQDGLNFTVTNTHQPTPPTKPTTPEQPTTPTVPSQPVTPTIPGQPSTPAQPSTPTSQGQLQLPQTGNHDALGLVALGLVLLSLTMVVVKQHD